MWIYVFLPLFYKYLFHYFEILLLGAHRIFMSSWLIILFSILRNGHINLWWYSQSLILIYQTSFLLVTICMLSLVPFFYFHLVCVFIFKCTSWTQHTFLVLLFSPFRSWCCLRYILLYFYSHFKFTYDKICSFCHRWILTDTYSCMSAVTIKI